MKRDFFLGSRYKYIASSLIWRQNGRIQSESVTLSATVLAAAHFTMAQNREKTKRKQPEPVDDDDDEEENWCFECKDGGQLVICDHE